MQTIYKKIINKAMKNLKTQKQIPIKKHLNKHTINKAHCTQKQPQMINLY